ncbi:P-loop containing nucleoside triphosphate hydrolase protein [Xylaria bambusicola]|uniref:P-loop containing nucleoside triphosphate hydrolase protein n=1 Tax=Xylaria bambusicola TaxID=326684 RepID=UPI002008727C|nr:P-loop containing nucleoside triphosphate hydrolase protein [Xylaria bambusicola]KAI0526544.1 P-loop containing nucleoside triphosphate hydrolase protein [Xylaria bambusicola]
MDDPWEWDVDRVVQELCTPNRSWHPSSTPLKLPPLDQLEEALRQQEVDGEVLLTYDQAELCAELGIKILKHKSTFKNAIQEIRLLSSRYRVYRKRQASELEDVEESVTDARSPIMIPNKGASEEQIQLFSSAGARPEHRPLANGSSITAIDEQPAKRRKITPTLVTSTIDPHRNRKIATEADTVFLTPALSSAPTEKEPVELLNNLAAGAYLGNKSITRFDIIDFSNPGHLKSLGSEDKQLNFVSTARLIPGRMIQTHRLMKRRLLRNTAPLRTTFNKKSDIVQGWDNPDHDKVLPLYGDSDDDMEYDTETWREIEAERKEEDLKRSLPPGLTAEEIRITIERVQQEMVSKWQISKLPKNVSKANHLWNNARISGLKEAIDRARRKLRVLDARIAKLKETTQKNDYRNIKELEHLVLSNFEVSVFDREYHLWLIGLLTSPSEPAKVKQHREPKARPPKPQPDLAEDEEILTSESEDDLNNFIVDDEEPLCNEGDYLSELGQDDSMSPRIPETPSRVRPEAASHRTLETPSKANQHVVIDLTTPPNRKGHIIRLKNGKLGSKASDKTQETIASSPLIMTITDLESTEQIVATALETVDQIYLDAIFSIIRSCDSQEVWLDLVVPALDREWPIAPYNTHVKKDSLAAYTLIRLFDAYREGAIRKLRRYRDADEKEKRRIRDLYKLYSEEWDAFIKFLARLSDRFNWKNIDMDKTKPRSTKEDSEEETDSDSRSDVTNSDSDKVEQQDGPQSGQKKKRKKKRRRVMRNHEAAMARGRDQAFAKEQESRRKNLRATLAAFGSSALGSQHGRLIVNESKGDDQGFIYIHDDIAPRIKQHQIEGVRFMWDQLVVAKERQGCLLAHTMGLGKTMQVITLLITINEASVSDDPTVVSQIPEEMHQSRTLILCPATLVNNWMDESLTWLPEPNILGNLLKVDAVMSVEDRIQTIQKWGAEGGILIIGYSLFKAFIEDGDMRDVLLDRPNIVVADEAHMMKNPKSKTHSTAAKFRTLSRVALTGSPLANNVEEYYAMINWVAPNYLGDIREFRSEYANPIKDGLQADSTWNDRRKALRMLRVLKSEVAPKVNRKTIAVLKQGIPDKTEFVITVPLTLIQRQAYEMFIQFHKGGQSDSTQVPQFAIHDLGLICASPLIFMEKLKDPGGKSADKTETATLPRKLISDEMALLRTAVREVKDTISLSWKVLLLLEILRQCKEVGDHVLLFSHSVVALNYLEGILRMKRHSFMRLDGKTQMAERQNLVKRFNKGNIDIFLISTKAGALGLNITGANRVIIFDAQFNPQNEQQAVGRAYRIGQTKPVYVYRFVCGGTCEEKLLHQAIWKMQLASRVVDKKNFVKKAPRLAKVWEMPEESKQEELDPLLGKDAVLDALIKDTKSREGIRAIQMMDVFEEEAVEDAELLPEDINLSNVMIQANEARRMGQPIPAHVSAALAELGGIGYGHDFVPSGQPLSVGLPTGHQHFPQPSSTQPLDIGQAYQPLPVAHQPSHAILMSSSTHLPYNARPPLSLTPMQLQGAEVHVSAVDSDWTTLSAVQTEVTQAFTAADFPDQQTRSRVSFDVSNAIWDTLQRLPPTEKLAMEWAIKRAVFDERFVQALSMGLLSPQQLSQLAPDDIDRQREIWRGEVPAEWDTRKNTWSQRNLVRDPEVNTPAQEHQHNASN